MSTALQADPALLREPAPASAGRVATDGKFLRAGDERFLVKGVTYGTFAPDADGYQFPAAEQVAEDFRLMAELGINTVRTYTPPRRELLDEAARHGLRVMVGLPVVAARRVSRRPAAEARASGASSSRRSRELGDHPAVLDVRARQRDSAGRRALARPRARRAVPARVCISDAKSAAPEALFTYVNFPPTEFLDLSFFDVCAFNVYLHREPELRAYLARLQHIAGHKPLLLAEAGAD